MRGFCVVSVIALLSGCMEAEEIVQMTARQQAKQVVNGVVAQKLPGVNAAPVTDCIIDAASTQEIITIGTSAVTGMTPATSNLILSIAQRPAAITCIAGNGTGLLSL